ncbi:hypothetical protein HDU78_010474 [Chytriomyces hyalinus]|nr:hypothetical protein HDU78_010474 [Chytriomyces hyalinus]
MDNLPPEILGPILAHLPIDDGLRELVLCCTATARLLNGDPRFAFRHMQKQLPFNSSRVVFEGCTLFGSVPWWKSLPFTYKTAAVAHLLPTLIAEGAVSKFRILTPYGHMSAETGLKVLYSLESEPFRNECFGEQQVQTGLLDWAATNDFADAASMLLDKHDTHVTSAKSLLVFESITRCAGEMVQMLVAHPNACFFKTQYLETAMDHLMKERPEREYIIQRHGRRKCLEWSSLQMCVFLASDAKFYSSNPLHGVVRKNAFWRRLAVCADVKDVAAVCMVAGRSCAVSVVSCLVASSRHRGMFLEQAIQVAEEEDNIEMAKMLRFWENRDRMQAQVLRHMAKRVV